MACLHVCVHFRRFGVDAHFLNTNYETNFQLTCCSLSRNYRLFIESQPYHIKVRLHAVKMLYFCRKMTSAVHCNPVLKSLVWIFYLSVSHH